MPRLIVEKSRIESNIQTLRGICQDTKIIGVVKGNGYGLDCVKFAQLLLDNGFDLLAVADVEEAETLRQAGINCEILLLSPTCIKEQAEKIVDLELTASIGSSESALALSAAAMQANKLVKAHLKIDTGFGRFGFLPQECDKIALCVSSLQNVEITGIFSHFASSFGKPKYTEYQFSLFMQALKELETMGIATGLRHISNSCAALRFPEMRLDAVRIGSALLGRLPIKNKYGLLKVGRLEAPIDEIRYLPKGHLVGYACTYKTKKITRTAVAIVGTGDGLAIMKSKDTLRFLDRIRYMYNDFKFLFQKGAITCTINGKRANVIGRVGLTNAVLDISRCEDAQPGDSAVFEINPLMVDSALPRVYE